MKKEIFLGKYVKLSLKPSFVINGTIIDADDHGITFETSKETRWISYNEIKNIKPLE